MHDNRPAEAPDRCAGKIAVDVEDLVVGYILCQYSSMALCLMTVKMSHNHFVGLQVARI